MSRRNEKKGYIHIYFGDGKGKTTEAVGLSVRFAGSGGKVLFTQFLKDGSSSELGMLKLLTGIRVFSFTERLGFSFHMNEQQKKEAAVKYTAYLRQIIEMVSGGEYGMLVMDEAVGAYGLNFIDHEMLLDFLKNRPQFLEVVLTGRNPAPELVELADYMSEICKRRHPFDQGVPARRGVEF